MTINELYKQVGLLSRDKEYSFKNEANKNMFKFISRDANTHALLFQRIQGDKISSVSVSEKNLKKIVNKVRAYVPFQIDVIVGASGNWRSLFESALAYTPQFHICSLHGQRHLIWTPNHPHDLNVLSVVTDDMLKVFEKQSRYYDYQYFLDNCYPYGNNRELYKNGINVLLKSIRTKDNTIMSVYNIASSEAMMNIIQCLDLKEQIIEEGKNVSLYDVAMSYMYFLRSKEYFSFY